MMIIMVKNKYYAFTNGYEIIKLHRFQLDLLSVHSIKYDANWGGMDKYWLDLVIIWLCWSDSLLNIVR